MRFKIKREDWFILLATVVSVLFINALAAAYFWPRYENYQHKAQKYDVLMTLLSTPTDALYTQTRTKPLNLAAGNPDSFDAMALSWGICAPDSLRDDFELALSSYEANGKKQGRENFIQAIQGLLNCSNDNL